jgi:hypothetical protein
LIDSLKEVLVIRIKIVFYLDDHYIYPTFSGMNLRTRWKRLY